jgi:L-rhamnose mutarotase
VPETIALHTRLKPGAAEEYEAAHASIPPELVAALRDAGVLNWRIWRSGEDLFHLVDVQDYQAMRHALADHPANVPWQTRMSELLAVGDDYSGNDQGIPKVWELVP